MELVFNISVTVQNMHVHMVAPAGAVAVRPSEATTSAVPVTTPAASDPTDPIGVDQVPATVEPTAGDPTTAEPQEQPEQASSEPTTVFRRRRRTREQIEADEAAEAAAREARSQREAELVIQAEAMMQPAAAVAETPTLVAITPPATKASPWPLIPDHDEVTGEVVIDDSNAGDADSDKPTSILPMSNPAPQAINPADLTPQ